MSVSMTGSGEIATPVESSKSAMTWGPIFGGAAAAIGVTLILLLLGSGVGLTMVSPWSGQSSSLGTVGVTAAIWLVGDLLKECLRALQVHRLHGNSTAAGAEGRN